MDIEKLYEALLLMGNEQIELRSEGSHHQYELLDIELKLAEFIEKIENEC